MASLQWWNRIDSMQFTLIRKPPPTTVDDTNHQCYPKAHFFLDSFQKSVQNSLEVKHIYSGLTFGTESTMQCFEQFPSNLQQFKISSISNETWLPPPLLSRLPHGRPNSQHRREIRDQSQHQQHQGTTNKIKNSHQKLTQTFPLYIAVPYLSAIWVLIITEIQISIQRSSNWATT